MQDSYLGIEIGGTKLQLVRSDAALTIQGRFRQSVDPDRGATGIREGIQEGIKTLLGGQEPRAVGIGFGGPVDWRTQQVACSHHVKGWDGFNLGQWVTEHCGAPVFIDNDANVAGLAEALHGAGRGYNPVFYITLGSGVGGGLIVNGSIYHGTIPGESEIGHLRLNREGMILEDSCSGWAVDRKIRAAIEGAPSSELARHVKSTQGPAAKALGPALGAKDPLALSILDATTEDLALGLSHVIHLQHPETVIIGGGLSLLGQPLIDAVEKALPKYVMEIMHPPPRLQLAQLIEDVVPIGALALAKLGVTKAKEQ